MKFRSGLNGIFHYECPFIFAFKSEFNSSAEVLPLWVMKNDTTSASNFIGC